MHVYSGILKAIAAIVKSLYLGNPRVYFCGENDINCFYSKVFKV